MNSDAVVALAAEAGFVVTTNDMEIAQSELSEEELEHLAGGGSTWGVIQCKGETPYTYWQKCCN